MPRLALLLRASANRVYGASTITLTQAEVAAFDRRALRGSVTRQEVVGLGGVDYLAVDSKEALHPAQVAVLSNLSALHALFELEPDGRLAPVMIAPRRVLDEDLVTIQRYPGKTNEMFTHLLVNVALAACGDALARVLAGERVALLDPVCGRGTTLNRAALYGMDAYGIELDQRDAEAHALFFTTWLKDKRLKHDSRRATLRKGRATPAHRVTTTYGSGKDRGAHRVMDVVHDDTVAARDHFKARSMDLLVADLPYGVQHGAAPTAGELDRGPGRLLAAALPVWFDLVRPGGAAALAWNRRTLPRPTLVQLLTDAGFDVLAPDDERFVHRVDRAINRDVIVAQRP
jgi:hypothetical protein